MPIRRRRRNEDEREFQPIQSLLDQANLLIRSEASNATVVQLINATSGRSTIEFRRDAVQLRVLSVTSLAHLNPRQCDLEVTVEKPVVLVNISDRILLEQTSVDAVLLVDTQSNSS